MTELGRALLASFSPEDLAELAERLEPFLPAPAATPLDGWLTSREASEHLRV